MISLIHLEELDCALSCGVRQGLEITVYPLFLTQCCYTGMAPNLDLVIQSRN